MTIQGEAQTPRDNPSVQDCDAASDPFSSLGCIRQADDKPGIAEADVSAADLSGVSGETGVELGGLVAPPRVRRWKQSIETESWSPQ